MPTTTLKPGIVPHCPIGLFDSGLGGLTVLRELARLLPEERFLYLGDTARLPYGTKGATTIVRYARECARFLVERNVKALVIACNTASSVGLDILREELPCVVIGTIEPAAEAAIARTTTGGIAVIGTDATVASGAYERAIAARAPHLTVISKACPLFVPLVEQGMFEGEIVERVVELYLGEIDFSRFDTLILGCTHYPLLKKAIRAKVGGSVSIIDSAVPIAHELERVLGAADLCRPSGLPRGSHTFFATDEIGRFNRLAAILLENEPVTAVKVEELALLDE